jgi:hypothetical protein
MPFSFIAGDPFDVLSRRRFARRLDVGFQGDRDYGRAGQIHVADLRRWLQHRAGRVFIAPISHRLGCWPHAPNRSYGTRRGQGAELLGRARLDQTVNGLEAGDERAEQDRPDNEESGAALGSVRSQQEGDPQRNPQPPRR